MNRKYVVCLNEEERAQLRQSISSGTAPARRICRAYLLLQSDSSPEGPNWSSPHICAALGVSEVTIPHVRQAYCPGGMEAGSGCGGIAWRSEGGSVGVSWGDV
jgi:hypothetical protein